jgi:hypothetical protein
LAENAREYKEWFVLRFLVHFGPERGMIPIADIGLKTNIGEALEQRMNTIERESRKKKVTIQLVFAHITNIVKNPIFAQRRKERSKSPL